MENKHKTLGCSLILTENHLITFREDFNSPLQQFKQAKCGTSRRIKHADDNTKPIADGENMVRNRSISLFHEKITCLTVVN